MGNRTVPKSGWLILLLLLAAAASVVVAEDRLLVGEKTRLKPVEGDNPVRHRCLMPPASDRIILPLERDKPWSLPKAALAADFSDTVNILVLRFNFQFENPDDPSTTGRGHMDVTGNWEDFLDSAGHFIDPPPHDSLYFDAHMRALRTYWEIVSDGKLTLNWDIYPSGADNVYQLPQPMNYYGRCDFEDVIPGLEAYFIDAIQTADAASPEIDFGRYESIFLFHAGSDRQNDIGFPTTCNDLFTGFIVFGDSLAVDGGANYVRTALILPETSNQDNRATALNAVMAHEFGHQLGLVDLYSTSGFMSMLGDFALMDNNGFGTGIDFGFEAGSVFGAIPIYPIAWSRAFLGFAEVVDYREETDIRLVAAEMVSEGIKIARVPITEYEYYLIENRCVDIDGQPAAARLDSATNVILGPTDTNRVFNREYDFLLPGSGMLIYHVDERVAALDYDYNGRSNFADNQLQWPFDIYGNRVDRFIRLVEADGVVNFGGIYRAGYGEEDDMFRDDRNHSFTPNTNPAAIDNSYNNTHVYVTDIGRDTDTSVSPAALMDTVMLFDLETDRMAAGFPVRAGLPVTWLSPIADDLNGDGNPEIIFASNDLLCVVTPDSQNFLRQHTGCLTCPVYEDTAYATVNFGAAHLVPLYARTGGPMTAGPVTGEFSDDAGNRLVVVGHAAGDDDSGRVELYSLVDADEDGQADLEYGIDTSYFNTAGMPKGLSFGNVLFVITDSGWVYTKELFNEAPVANRFSLVNRPRGWCQVDGILIILAGFENSSSLHFVAEGAVSTVTLNDDRYRLGPVAADLDLDENDEIILADYFGKVSVIEVDVSTPDDPVRGIFTRELDFSFTAGPVVADIDLDGLPDIVFGGTNAIYAFNHELTLKTSFPIEVNDRFPTDLVIFDPIVVDLQEAGVPEIVVSTPVGNIYSFGGGSSYGFPLSAGEMSSGSPVFVTDTVGGRLGYLGADGWFYLWDVDDDVTTDFWPMFGADPAARFAFDTDKLPAPKQYASRFPPEQFYNYPNPVVDGATTIRYFLAEEATSVELNVYDLSGREVASFEGPTSGGVDNEIVWSCGNITPGVYRCVIRVSFSDSEETAFTDIAIIK